MVKKLKGTKRPASAYDLWDAEATPNDLQSSDEGVKHMLRVTKAIGSSKWKNNKYVNSVLPAVPAPQAGASYNPTADDYLEYANKIAAEENAEMKQERWTARKMALREGDRYATRAEIEREEVMGLLDSDTDDVKEEIKEEILDEDEVKVDCAVKSLKTKPKTMKQRRRELQAREKELEKIATKRTRKQEAELTRIRTHLKAVEAELKKTAQNTVERRRKRVVKKLTERKRLGHGKFEDFKEPVLLPNELSGTLRGLKSTGANLLTERVRSLEKRNILPIKSDKPVNTLKTSLKFKVTDKRETKDFLEAEYAKLEKLQPKKKPIRRFKKRTPKKTA